MRPSTYREDPMRKLAATALIVTTASALAVGAAAFEFRPDRALRVATGLTAETLCTDVFITGLDPQAVFAQAIKARPGVKLVARHISYRVDRDGRSVRATWFGHFPSTAVLRPGRGCLVVHGDVPAPAAPGAAEAAPRLLPDIAGPDVVEPANPGLKAALDHVFTDAPGAAPRWLRAVVVLKDGKVVAERYAPGIGTGTPLIGYSASKSVMSRLVGILQQQGKLQVQARAPVAAWSAPDDPRRAITLDNLLRMTSGLDIAQTGSGFDPASRMLFTERDMAAYAEAHKLARPIGSRWDYSDASTLIVSRIVRDAAGGTGDSVQAFARRALFEPLGMKTAILTGDATGTPVGSTGILASARDWAKLGELYARDGMVGGQRILPEGWVRYSAASTLGTSYGAGFWTNDGGGPEARARIRGGMPCDMLFASGVLGQRVYIVPSADVVIVRFGVTQAWPDFDIESDVRLVREVLAALPPSAAPACAKTG
jgi:hypothetical protein